MCLAKSLVLKLRKSSKYEVQVNISKELPMCQRAWAHLRKAVTEATDPNGRTVC